MLGDIEGAAFACELDMPGLNNWLATSSLRMIQRERRTVMKMSSAMKMSRYVRNTAVQDGRRSSDVPARLITTAISPANMATPEPGRSAVDMVLSDGDRERTYMLSRTGV